MPTPFVQCVIASSIVVSCTCFCLSVTAGERIALEPPEQRVLGEHLQDATIRF